MESCEGVMPWQGLCVSTDCSGLRLDLFLAQQLSISRASVQQWIEQGLVHVNGEARPKRFFVQAGDGVSFCPPEPSVSHVIPEQMLFDILYEDGELFVINKPPGLVVHPAPGNRSGTFVNGFMAYCHDLQCTDPIRPGVVHRLDKDTSGVLVAAKTPGTLAHLSRQFQERLVTKEYVALIVGHMAESVRVAEPIGRDPRNRQRMAVVSSGKEAETEFFPCGKPFRIGRQYTKDCTLVTAKPRTGRTHQIRVHLASLGTPVLGDALYGGTDSVVKEWRIRQMLHCRRLGFIHPKTGESVVVEAPIPKDMRQMLPKSADL